MTFTFPFALATAQSDPAGPPPLIVTVILSVSLFHPLPMIAHAEIILPSAAVHVLLAKWISRASCAISVVSHRKKRACPLPSVPLNILDGFICYSLFLLYRFLAVMWMR